MRKIVISEELIRSAMQSQTVRDRLDQRRDRIASRARALASREEVDADIRTSSGTRPQGRPYARVTADAEQEFGSSMMGRARILGRAGEETE